MKKRLVISMETFGKILNLHKTLQEKIYTTNICLFLVINHASGILSKISQFKKCKLKNRFSIQIPPTKI